ncbi:MAG TPA: YqaE/Pmp3 family membrane protein [Sediminibacterium sp.]|nr:YqaE/Pmp3 family membrane protein [Sediminibacterium sp.]
MKKIATGLSVAVLCCALTVQSAASVVVTEPVTGSAKPAETTAPVMNDAAVQDAMLQFKSLSRVERKARFAEVKKMAKAYKAQKATGNGGERDTVLLAILAILLPPLAVYLHENQTNGKFWISVLLTLLFWLPGVIYALIVVL